MMGSDIPQICLKIILLAITFTSMPKCVYTSTFTFMNNRRKFEPSLTSSYTIHQLTHDQGQKSIHIYSPRHPVLVPRPFVREEIPVILLGLKKNKTLLLRIFNDALKVEHLKLKAEAVGTHIVQNSF